MRSVSKAGLNEQAEESLKADVEMWSLCLL